jgi:AraC-like DNA-binding protein
MPIKLASTMLAMETGSFTESAPRPFLHQHFQSTWTNRFSNPDERALILPDGFVHLRWLDGRLSIRGPDRSARIEELRRGSLVVGFKFQPGAASLWLNGPISIFAGVRIPLEEIWGSKAREIAEWAGEANTETEIVQRIEIGLEDLARDLPSPDAEAQPMLSLLDSKGGAPAADAVKIASMFGVSVRTLRRRYEQLFGYGPKTLERILRFQRFLTSVRSSSELYLADCAMRAGYADQPHLSRESRRICGLSPRMIVERLKG